MNITLEMIMTRFCELQPAVQISYDFNVEQIRGIQLLPSDTVSLPTDFLYVTDECEVLSLSLSESGLCILALPTDILPLAEGFNCLIKCYGDFIEWDRQLDFALIKEASFQDFLDISDRFFKCPILIYDPALKLLAYSGSYENVDDKIFQTAIKNGYLDHEAIDYFITSHTFDEIDTSGQSGGDADDIRMHSDMIRSINIDNQPVIYCIMLYTNDYPRSYLAALFDNLYNVLYDLMRKKMSDFVRNRSVTDYFLMDLLDNPDTPAQQIQERNYHNDLPYEGNYILINICSEHVKQSSANYYIQMLRNSMVNCRVFLYKGSIVVLYILPALKYREQKEYLTNVLTPLAAGFSDKNLSVFVSRGFRDLSYFAACYRQTQMMKIYTVEGGIFFYDELMTDCLLCALPADHRVYSLCHPVILKLHMQNTKKSRQLLHILKLYLENDRNLTQTAELLHMHRNNVIYHVKQFEEMYGLDLADYATKLNLLISFKVLDM